MSARTKLYGCVVGRGHYLERIEGGGYDREEYEQYPDRYISTFNKKVKFNCNNDLVHFASIIFFTFIINVKNRLLLSLQS